MIVPRFRSYDVRELESVAPLFREERCGIYILEFSNGDRYVGQAKDVTRRFAQHRHGGKHHPPWPDIVSLETCNRLSHDTQVLHVEHWRGSLAL